MQKVASYLRKVLTLTVFITLCTGIGAQQRKVSGQVVDSDGEPLPGAGVMVEGTSRGVATDLEGYFTIEASASDYLIASFIGYRDQRVRASENNITIVLSYDGNFLEETVVVGYGTQKKATLTGAVSSVGNKDIIVTKNENVLNMLSGKIPGVRITQNSAQPGEFDNSIDIRGMGDPLIIVDGIPRDRAYFSRMDANEIDNVSVLKDASAAVYGVRAANGVILVTTRHGSGEGQFNIDFSGNVGWQQFLYVPKTSDVLSHAILMNEKVWNSISVNYPTRGDPAYTEEMLQPYRSGEKVSTSWYDELFRDFTPQGQYNLSINGSSDKIDYFLNLGYMDQMGSYKSGSLNYERWNFRSNVDARITGNLRATVQISGFMDTKNQPYSKSNNLWEVYKKAWTYPPNAIAWVDDERTIPAYDIFFLEAENPVTTTNSAYAGSLSLKNKDFNAAFSLVYDIPGVKGLSLKAFYSFDYYLTDTDIYKRSYNLYSRNADGTLTSYPQNSPGRVSKTHSSSTGNVFQGSVNFDRTFASAHHVNAMLLFEHQYNTWEDMLAQRDTYYDNPYLFAGEEANQIGSMNGVGEKSRMGIVGRLNYDYKGRYMVDFAFREDASSSFPKASRWGFFPSVSAGWRISEEQFIKNSAPWITNLKIRASWGMMGDDASASTYPSTVVGYQIDADRIGWKYDASAITPGVYATAVANPNLTWYTAKTWNAGVDWSLWKQKFGGTVEVFSRKREGLLATSSAVIPATVGASLPQENLESDRTFGWEVQLSHYNRIGEVDYYVNGQLSATKSRWLYHMDTPAGNSMQNWRRTSVSGRNKDIWFSYEEGGRFSSYEEIQYHGATGANYGSNTLPGDYWYVDWNEDGIVDANDIHPVATYNLPVFTYGLSLGMNWKGIDLSLNFQGAAGVYTSFNEVFATVGPFNNGAAFSWYLDRWHTLNSDDDPWNPHTQWTEGYYPATGHSFNTGSTGIHNASYLRLKTLELGYTFPDKLLRSIFVKQLRVYFSGYNLFTVSGMKYTDPERPSTNGGSNMIMEYNYPVNRTYNIGFNIKF